MHDDIERQVRNTVRQWMRSVLADKGWSASEWARRAGVNPSSVTRPMDPACRIVMGLGTVARLSRACGTQPNLAAYTTLTQPSLRRDGRLRTPPRVRAAPRTHA